MNNEVEIRKIDAELQVVYGEVYVPDHPDSDGDFASSDEIRKMAHGFMKNLRLGQVDMDHDNSDRGFWVVESFIARKDDPDFIEGAWVVGIHVSSPTVWKQVKDGEINGFSMEAMVRKEPVLLTLELPEYVEGPTSEAAGHTHTFKAYIGDDGNVVGGETDVVNGHSHSIRRSVVTEQSDGHTHRFSYLEALGYE